MSVPMSSDPLTGQSSDFSFAFNRQRTILKPGNKRPRTDTLVEEGRNDNAAITALTGVINSQNETIATMAKQIEELTATIKRLEKAQNKGNTKVAEIKATAKKTFAEVAGIGAPKTAPTAGRQTSQNAPVRKAPAPAKTGGTAVKSAVTVPKRMRRVVVLLGSKPKTSELAMREAINSALRNSKAPEGLMVLNVAFNERQNAIFNC